MNVKNILFFCHPLVPPNCCASTQVQLWCSYSAVAEWWRKNMMVYYFHRIFKWFETLYMKLGYEMLLCSFCSTVGFDFYYTVKVVSALSVTTKITALFSVAKRTFKPSRETTEVTVVLYPQILFVNVEYSFYIGKKDRQYFNVSLCDFLMIQTMFTSNVSFFQK